jgi:membrane protease YdiL (CAAX protease family)
MNFENQQNMVPTEPLIYSVPWQPIDNWIGVILLAVVDLSLLLISLAGKKGQLAQSGVLVLVQLAYLLPVVIIFAYRRINWRALGIGRFNWGMVSLGCGLLVVAYLVIYVHNLILTALGIPTQGVEISGLFEQLHTPIWFFLVGAILAPLVEETFFRGFLFQGFRARYGWITGMLLSSAIFAIAHLDIASLIPTFILGNLLAYLYHRTNSIWPGVILHMTVNTFGLLSIYFLTQHPGLIPS